MKKKQIIRIEETLARFQNGDLYKPVNVEGSGEYRIIANHLETLRLKMLNYSDREQEIEQRANKAVSAVAHDMKTPLAIISGYAECISDGIDDKDYPALILQKTQQMNDMVIDLVNSSQSELKKQGSHKILHDSRVLFGKICEKLYSIVESKGIKLKINKIPSEKIRADESQIERVMQNLISNAVKYSPEKSVVVIKFYKRDNRFVICVKDRGIGISKESLPLIFDQFYTEDKSRTNADSQGVGLYVVKGIITGEHGGNVSVKSKKGKGSRFYVSLPIEPNLEDKISFTKKFDRLPLFKKIFIGLIFGWCFASIYRIAKYSETRCLSTLIQGLLSLVLFPFIWIVDLISLILSGRITQLAD